MSTVLGESHLSRIRPEGWRAALAVLAGLLLLYVPTYVTLAQGAWHDEAYAHGPIVLGLFAWLAWRRREVLADGAGVPARAAGALALALGLALWLLGRTQALLPFEVASHIPVVAGAVLLVGGWAALRTLAFPIALLFFLVPLPGFILDAVTTPLKTFVSAAVAYVLPWMGYAVERSGVVLDVEGHAMLVADACSGLNSLYSLFAMALVYTQLTGTPRAARVGLLLAAIVPIAVVANIVRVLFLVLVTVHLGDDAAQGLLHTVAGLLVFVIALGLLMLLDRAFAVRGGTPGAESGARPRSETGVRSRVGFSVLPFAALGAMAVVAAAAPGLKPQPAAGPAMDLERVLPATFGDWRIDPDLVPIAPTADVKGKLDRLYRQVVSRTYVNGQGTRMMLTVAYGGDQSDALKAHRQEACYAAQGFDIVGVRHGTLEAAGRSIPVTRMVAARGERVEPVTYWFTMGDRVVLSRWERLRTQVENGLAGRIPDGLLVRVSSLSPETGRAFAEQRAFVDAILAAVPPAEAARFAGARKS